MNEERKPGEEDEAQANDEGIGCDGVLANCDSKTKENHPQTGRQQEDDDRVAEQTKRIPEGTPVESRRASADICICAERGGGGTRQYRTQPASMSEFIYELTLRAPRSLKSLGVLTGAALNAGEIAIGISLIASIRLGSSNAD